MEGWIFLFCEQKGREGRRFEMGLEKWGKGRGGLWAPRVGELRAMGGSVGDVLWMRGIKGRRCLGITI